jgi:hypothetical protein
MRRLIDPYAGADRSFLTALASYSAYYEGGHHIPIPVLVLDRDYDPARDDTTTHGETQN